MADKGKLSSLFDLNGNPYTVEQVKQLVNDVITGGSPSVARFKQKVMPIAQDRFYRTPIYELDKQVMTAPGAPPLDKQAFYDAGTQSVILNPLFTKRSGTLDQTSSTRRLIGHEMFHHIQNVEPGVLDKANKAFQATDDSGRYTLASKIYNNLSADLSGNERGRYEKKVIPFSGGYHYLPHIEAQAYIASGTSPDFYNQSNREKLDKPISGSIEGSGIAKTLFSFLAGKDFDVYRAEPEAVGVAQKVLFSTLPEKAKKRMQSLQVPISVTKEGLVTGKPSESIPEAPQQSVLDKFMSIIGLGVK